MLILNRRHMSVYWRLLAIITTAAAQILPAHRSAFVRRRFRLITLMMIELGRFDDVHAHVTSSHWTDDDVDRRQPYAGK